MMGIRMSCVWLLVASAMAHAACNRAESTRFTVAEGKVERVNDCHVHLDQIRYYEDGSPLGDFRFACNVPEAAQKEKNWWGNQTPPLMNSLDVGDCMRLDKTFYCVEDIVSGKGATLKATFKSIDSDVTIIDRVK